MTETLLQTATSEGEVAMAHLVGLATELTVGSHMTAGGELAKAALTAEAAAAASAVSSEGGGLLGRLRAAGQELGQWRVDRNAMGSGFLPLTRKAPPAAVSSERIVNVPKQESPIWREFKSHKETVKTNGAGGKRKEYYEWDYTHNDIEVYDYRGHHLGSKNPVTGELYKGPEKSRDIRGKI
jgi:hypothetical protein